MPATETDVDAIAYAMRRAADPAERSRLFDGLLVLAESGDAMAQFQLGLLYASGQGGLAADRGTATRWCAAAAGQGLAVAQYNLGLLHIAGEGAARDPDAAARWLRLAAINGIGEAEACLDLLYREDEARPRSWAEAETRVSVALERSDPAAPKTVRFAEYYVDPCLDLLMSGYRFSREESEDIVQQFFLELEEPLSRGAHSGRPWKESIRSGYAPDRGRFRHYLSRVLVNFAREYLRRGRRAEEGSAAPAAAPDPLAAAEACADDWRPVLARFQGEIAGTRPDAARAAMVLAAALGEAAPHAGLAARYGLTERTIRSDLRFGSELLTEWLAAQAEALAQGRMRDAIGNGVRLLPQWLHRLGAEKRARALLLLALVGRQRAPD